MKHGKKMCAFTNHIINKIIKKNNLSLILSSFNTWSGCGALIFFEETNKIIKGKEVADAAMHND